MVEQGSDSIKEDKQVGMESAGEAAGNGESSDAKIIANDKVAGSEVSASESNPVGDSTDSKKASDDKAVTNDKTDLSNGEVKKPKKPKPRVLKTTEMGIYTITHLERDNSLLEWGKHLKESIPYILRLAKTFWALSPTRATILILIEVAEALFPSAGLYVRKTLLDEVQRAATSRDTKSRKLVLLALANVVVEILEHSFDVIKDKIDDVMETRLKKVLQTELVEANLRLDADQLSSRKIFHQFGEARTFANGEPPELLYRALSFVKYLLIIGTSTYTLSRMMSREALPLLGLNLFKTLIYIYRLIIAYAHSIRYEITNKTWHRQSTIKDIAHDSTLRRDIKVTGIENWLLEEIASTNEILGDIVTTDPRYHRASRPWSFAKRLMINIIGSLEYAWLISRGTKRGVTLGTLHLVSRSTDEIVTRIYSLTLTAQRFAREWKALISYYKCLQAKPQLETPANPKEYVCNPAGISIEAKNIHYKYDPIKGKDVLKGTSFVINPGEMVAVVGFNGAGKSTLAKLLTRLADPNEGELLFNGINVKEYDPATLRRHIAVLFQDIGQYKGFTITENIGVGNITNITPESIKEAAETAGAAEFIEQLPYKYDSFLGHMPGWYYTKHSTSALGDSDTESEDESEEKKEEQKKIQKNISGGQWQKIALARAFMRGSAADLLILDEPTANLDPEAEYNLFQTIKKFRKNRTTVYISHRFNTVRAADRIMVMEDGKVIEMGSHEELMRIKDGKYHRLYTLQVKGFMLDDKGGVSKDVNGVILDVKENVVKEIVASSV